MDLRRIRYTIALLCLVTTIVLITYKLTANQKGSIEVNKQVSEGTGEEQLGVDWNFDTPEQQKNNNESSREKILKKSSSRQDLSTTIPLIPTTNFKQVMQGPNPYLLINDQYLIPLSTMVYGGMWTGVVKLSGSPLIVYYRYELSFGKGYTYLYELSANSSRELDQLTMVGKIGQIFLFSIIQSTESYRGLSAMIDGSLTTLYTGDYTTAQYLGDTIKLNNSQEIYLSLRASGS